ncbi:hypothetical protein QBC39DRAFT_372681 [Podospora conica]|nr:hypothetical protein QBC39DRAFT_372681 [Schizothecium conicum]
MIPAKSIQTTRWGTACAQCASAKAKCSRQYGSKGSKCDRCERLLKPCTEQAHRPRKIRQSRQPSPKDGDPFVIEPGFEMPTPPADGSRQSSEAASNPPSPPEQLAVPRRSRASSSLRRASRAPQTDCHCQRQVPGGSDAADDDAELLRYFREELMPQFPFVHVTESDVEELQSSKPILMMTIRTVARARKTRSRSSQIGHLMGSLTQQMLLRAERSLDLLSGILTILAWHHFHCLRHSQLNNLVCLADGLIADLGLAREAKETTNEERRLVLGAWYLKSCIAAHLDQIAPPAVTETLAQHVSELEQASEYESDMHLVGLIKIQHVTNTIVAFEDASCDPEAVSNLHDQLENIRIVTTPPHDLRDALILLHEKSAEVRLSGLQSRSNQHVLKAWLESWIMTIPTSAYHTLPTTTLFQLMHTVVALAKWAQTITAHGQPTSLLSCHTIRRLYEFTEHAALTGVPLIEQLTASGKTLGETTGLLAGAPVPTDMMGGGGGQNINVIPSSPTGGGPHGNPAAFLYAQQDPDSLAFAFSAADYSGTVTPDFSHHSPQQHSPQYFTPSLTPVGTTPEMQALQLHPPPLGQSTNLPPAGSWAGPSSHDWSGASSCESVWATASEAPVAQKGFDGVDPQMWYGHHQEGMGGGQMDGTQQAWQRQQGQVMDGDFQNGGYGFNVLRR